MTKRGKNKDKVDYSLPHIYKDYVKDLADKKGPYNVKRKIFGDILRDFNSEVIALIILRNFEYKMPARMGTKRIRKKKKELRVDSEGNLITKGFSVDWKATRDLWASDKEAERNKTRVFHLNEHTDGYSHKWFWSKQSCNVENKSIYQFKACRANKRGLGKVLKTNDTVDYYE